MSQPRMESALKLPLYVERISRLLLRTPFAKFGTSTLPLFLVVVVVRSQFSLCENSLNEFPFGFIV